MCASRTVCHIFNCWSDDCSNSSSWGPQGSLQIYGFAFTSAGAESSTQFLSQGWSWLTLCPTPSKAVRWTLWFCCYCYYTHSFIFVCGTQDNLWEVILFWHRVGYRERTQMVRLDEQLYPLSYIISCSSNFEPSDQETEQRLLLVLSICLSLWSSCEELWSSPPWQTTWNRGVLFHRSPPHQPADSRQTPLDVVGDDFNCFIPAMLSDDSRSRRHTAKPSWNDDL